MHFLSAFRHYPLYNGLRFVCFQSAFGVHDYAACDPDLDSRSNRGERQHQQPFEWLVGFVALPIKGKRIDLLVADGDFDRLRAR